MKTKRPRVTFGLRLPEAIPFHELMSTTQATGPLRLKRVLEISIFCLAVAFMIFLALTWFTDSRSGQISLEFVDYRQFTKGGRLFVEVRLTNGTVNTIQYFKLYDAEQTEFLPLVRTNIGLVWSEPRWLPQHMGVKMLSVPLKPHTAVVSVQPVIAGIGNYQFGVMYKPHQPIQPNKFMRRFHELLLKFVPRFASAQYLIPQEEATVWCPVTVSGTQ